MNCIILAGNDLQMHACMRRSGRPDTLRNYFTSYLTQRTPGWVCFYVPWRTGGWAAWRREGGRHAYKHAHTSPAGRICPAWWHGGFKFIINAAIKLCAENSVLLTPKTRKAGPQSEIQRAGPLGMRSHMIVIRVRMCALMCVCALRGMPAHTHTHI